MSQLKRMMREVIANAAMAVPAIRSLRAKRGRTTLKDVRAQARQMRDQFEFFMGTLGSVDGKTVAEVGPGDSVALGALFLQAGAEHYVAFDRFRGDVFGPYAQALYSELGCSPDPARVSLRPAIEDVDASNERRADVVVSFDVLEHVADPVRALNQMALLLSADGVMVHRIDYSPHDMWRECANPFAFLAVPDWLWDVMGSNRGYPNRARHVVFMHQLAALGFVVDERITRRFSLEKLLQIREKLLPRFRQLSDEELLVLLAELGCSRTRRVVLGSPFPY